VYLDLVLVNVLIKVLVQKKAVKQTSDQLSKCWFLKMDSVTRVELVISFTYTNI